MKKDNFNFNPIVADIEKIKAVKNLNKKKKPSTSIKPLKFEPNEDDSPLKAEIIRRINEKHLVYSDLYEYCTRLKDGDNAEGQKLGYNIISGLKNRRSMIDTTFSMLCDFLKLDVLLVARTEDTDEDENDEGDSDGE